MVKFSIVVPVYNVEQYLENCLESIVNQTYDNYEVIIVNDGSTDNSQSIIDKYVSKDKRFKSYIKKNGGLSDARNYGVTKVKGDYLLFVDSDDSINRDLLLELNKVLDNGDVDLIKFGVNLIKSDNEMEKVVCETKNNISGEEAFRVMQNNSLFVTAWSYVYKYSFWKKNNFKYEIGRVHEDYGLTPYVVLKANRVSIIDYLGYNYYVRSNSIMNNNQRDKLLKKNEDSLYLFDLNMKVISDDNKIGLDSRRFFESFMANGLINRCKLLDVDMLKEYILELKKRKIGRYLLSNNIGRLLKKVCFQLSPSLYIKMFVR